MKHVVGIDIGGTKIIGIVYNGKIVVKDLTIATPKTLFEFERNLFKLVDFLSAGQKVSAIGIGSAGLADGAKGTVRLSGNIKFKASLNLVRLIKQRYNLPAKVDNDANCFTRAEMLLGQGKNLNNFLGLTLGTGVGGGIVIGRKIYRGQGNSGAEFGHMVLDKGFFEKNYFQPARDGENYKALGAGLGKLLATLANIFAPQAIILGGGVSRDQARFLPLARREMKKYLFNAKSEPKILVSKLKNPGALGATLLFKR